MKFKRAVFYIGLSFFLIGCAEDVTIPVDETGWHFQGRDCLACHNTDLGVDKKLVVGTTMFKDSIVVDYDDLNEACDADLAIEFINSDFSVAYSSTDYYDKSSKGYRGRGNIFLMDRLFNSNLNGSYKVRIVDRTTGISLAQSATVHDYSGAEYDINNPDDITNRLSCNACHGVSTDVLYVQYNKNLCK